MLNQYLFNKIYMILDGRLASKILLYLKFNKTLFDAMFYLGSLLTSTNKLFFISKIIALLLHMKFIC